MLEFINDRGTLLYCGMPTFGIHRQRRSIMVWFEFALGFFPHFFSNLGRRRRAHLFPCFAYLSLTGSSM